MKNFMVVLAMFAGAVCANDDVSSDIKVSKQAGNSFSQQWGLDAINIPQSLVSHNAESLGLLAPEEHLSTDARLIARAGTWVKTSSKKGKYWLGQIQSTNLNAEFDPFYSAVPNELYGLNAAYVYGRFSAETGVINQQTAISNDQHFFLQGSYNIVAFEKLNVALTAQIETLGESQISHYYAQPQIALVNAELENKQAKNYTLGLVTTYSITKDWKILGMVSTTNLDNTLVESPFIEDSSVQMALIGTSYSF